jgi:hypothetical protein
MGNDISKRYPTSFIKNLNQLIINDVEIEFDNLNKIISSQHIVNIKFNGDTQVFQFTVREIMDILKENAKVFERNVEQTINIAYISATINAYEHLSQTIKEKYRINDER